MAIITTGTNFNPTQTVTSTELNDIANAATFDDPVDDSTLELHTDGKLRIKDAGVTAAKLATGLIADAVYPVGSIFTTVTNYADSAAVVTAIGGTTWTAFGSGKVLVGLDSSDTDFDTVEETGGAKTITLDVTQMPAHTHNVQVTQRVTGDDAAGGSRVLTANRNITTQTLNITGMTAKTTGGGLAHDNVQPYIVVYMWKRTN